MKIKLNSSANLTLPEALSNVDLSYGFTLYDSQKQTTSRITENNSFSMKLLAKIDKFLGVQEESQNFTEVIAHATQHLNNTLDTDLLKDTSVQLNNKTSLTMIFRNLGVFSQALNPYKAQAHSLQKQIVMGPDSIKATLANQTLKNKYSINITNEKTFFHEFAHVMEKHFLDIKERHFSEFMENIYIKLTKLNMPSYIEKTDKELAKKQDSKFLPVNQHLFHNLHILISEIYADVGGLLLQRNYEIEKGMYNSEKFKQYIEDIKLYRIEEHIEIEQKLPSVNAKNTIQYLNNINHLTAPGVDGLFEKIDALDTQMLSASEINKIAQKSVEQGMARTLLIMTHLDFENENQMNVFTNYSLNKENNLVKNEDPLNLSKVAKTLRQFAGENWSKSFDEHVTKTQISQESEIEKMKSIFYHGIKTTNQVSFENQTYLDKIVAISELKEATLESLLSNNSTKPQYLIDLENKHNLHNLAKTNNVAINQHENTEALSDLNNNSTLKNRISSIRQKISDNTEKNMLNRPKLKM